MEMDPKVKNWMKKLMEPDQTFEAKCQQVFFKLWGY